jgi:hypothetical protein
MIDDDRSTDDYQQQRLACVSRTASRVVRWIGSSRMDRVESVGSSRVESRICMHASVHEDILQTFLQDEHTCPRASHTPSY